MKPMDNRMAVLIAQAEELKQKEPNQLVLQACELFLAVTWQEMRQKMYMEVYRD